MPKLFFVTVLFCFFQLHSSEISSDELTCLLPKNPFFIPSEKVDQILRSTDLEMDELLVRLIPIAQRYARPPISDFRVGVAAVGESGNLYLGVNVEFAGLPLNFAVHAEQFLIANARSHGETGILKMAVSAAPCGHCRQFLYELDTKKLLEIIIPNCPRQKLSLFLPNAFGPQDLGVSENPWEQPNLDISDRSPLETKALEAAFASYAPYSLSKSSVAIQTSDGNIYSGAYVENAAFNPSLSPFQIALVALIADMHTYEDMTQVILVEHKEAKISQEDVTKALLDRIAPQIQLKKELL